MIHAKLHRGDIAIRTHATDDRDGDIAQVALVSERLALVDIADVHLHKGDGHTVQRITEGYALVGECAGVDLNVFVFVSTTCSRFRNPSTLD